LRYTRTTDHHHGSADAPGAMKLCTQKGIRSDNTNHEINSRRDARQKDIERNDQGANPSPVCLGPPRALHARMAHVPSPHHRDSDARGQRRIIREPVQPAEPRHDHHARPRSPPFLASEHVTAVYPGLSRLPLVDERASQ
jgi:hypothetical protein